jgi:hypothetical protein
MYANFKRHLTAVATACLLALPLSAQESTTTTTASTATHAATTAPAAEDVATATGYDSRQTRQEFNEVLNRHPHEVGVILSLDPSLFRNEAWLGAYPALKAFVGEHPEVAQNPSYFLENVSMPGDYTPPPPAVRAAQEFMEGLLIFTIFCIVTAALAWLVRTLLEHRRWSRISRVQTELHNKLLDRFTSHEDLLRYIQTGAGKQFLEGAVAPPIAPAPSIGAPYNRVLWSTQAGVVMTAVGIGVRIAAHAAHPDVAPTLASFGVIAISAGLGFVISGIISYLLSRRLGLWPASPLTAEVSEPTSR